jgi:hypothetical protein
VRHDAIIMPSNPDLPLIKSSLREFLRQIHEFDRLKQCPMG